MTLIDALVKVGLFARDPEPEPLHPNAPAAIERPADERKSRG